MARHGPSLDLHIATSSNEDSTVRPMPRSIPLANKQAETPAPSTTTASPATSNNASYVSLISSYTPSNATLSLRQSPDSLHAMSSLSSSLPTSMTLPEPSLPLFGLPMSPPTASSNAMSDAVTMSKGNGLIRRLSRGAHSKIVRRRPSATSQHRDSSVGPVIMRRRSDSVKGITDSGVDVSDLDLDSYDEDIEDLNEHFGQTPTSHPARQNAGATNGPTLSTRPSIGSLDSGIAPAYPLALQHGTWLTKVTGGKRKRMVFRFDFEASKIVWDPQKPQKSIYVDDIQDLREAKDVREYIDQYKIPSYEQSRWITIIYTNPTGAKGRSIKTMHLVCPDKATCQLWFETIHRVQKMRIRTLTDLVKGGERSIKDLWRRETKGDPTVTLDFQKAKQLCRKLDINCSQNTLRAHFDKADVDSNAQLDYTQFEGFVRSILERRDLKQIFNAIRKPGHPELDEESFMTFLSDTQGIDLSQRPQHWIQVFETHAKRCRPKGATSPIASEFKEYTMNFAAFQDLMTRTSFGKGINMTRTEQKLDRPLNEYFISSSHNTYLLGRQVAGHSSTEAYVSALTKGCRCVEIDCWDGSDGRPQVLHGRTLTSSILFSDCIRVIDEYAFVASEYPLIISLEVHCNSEQQSVMTDIMKSVFGDKLILEPLDPNSEVLPSPEELKGKILIKVKQPGTVDEGSPKVDGPPVTRRPRGLSSPFSRPTNVESTNAIHATHGLASPPYMAISSPASASWAESRSSLPFISQSPVSPASSAEESDSIADRKPRSKKTSHITKVLGALGVYTQGIKFTDFRSSEARTYNHIFSFGENTFENICGKDADSKLALEKHNRKYLMRVYPAGRRIQSTNFEPLRYWRRGVQMAALNWQTYDLGMQLGEAMFAAGNDRTGYVLKPEEMRVVGGSEVFDIPPRKTKTRLKFSVDVLSAQQLPRPHDLPLESHMNPYIEVEVHTAEDKAHGVASGEGGTDASARNGMSGIGSPLRKRTRIVQNNGWDPHFNEAMSFTVETKYPSLIFVRWTVWNSPDGQNAAPNSQPIASYTAKLHSLQQGYRHIPLKNGQNEQYYFSSLFCKIRREAQLEIKEISVVPVNSQNASPTSPCSGDTRQGFIKRVFSRTPSQKKTNGDVLPGRGALSRTTSTERSL